MNRNEVLLLGDKLTNCYKCNTKINKSNPHMVEDYFDIVTNSMKVRLECWNCRYNKISVGTISKDVKIGGDF